MLNHISVRGFRNLRDLEWAPSPASHVLVGKNGAGKTSVLEAAHLVATTRSFRTSQLRDCAARPSREEGRPAQQMFAIKAMVEGSQRVELDLSWGEEGLRRRLNGREAPLVEYLEAQPVVTWTTREEEILAGSPARRRRMMDWGLTTERLSRLSTLARMRRVLIQKRELLRSRQQGLDEWNRLLAELGAQVVAWRGSYVERLESSLAEVRAAANLDIPSVSLRYLPSPPEAREGAGAIEEALAIAAPEERNVRRPLVGPHLDRLQIFWGAVEVARIASAGERKALGLLLLRSQAAILAAAGRDPLIIADDIDADLDLRSLCSIWSVLQGSCQVLASTNREEVAAALTDSTQWRLENGGVRASTER